jgi:hypothetical protein
VTSGSLSKSDDQAAGSQRFKIQGLTPNPPQLILWSVSSSWHAIPGTKGLPVGNPVKNPCYELDEDGPVEIELPGEYDAI